MAQRQHLTIISTRFPLLALGVLLAKKGKKVLIVDSLPENPEPEERIAQGYLFRKRPVPLFGLDDHGLLRKLLDEVGIGRILVNKTYPANRISYQVILPSNRVNIYPEREKLLLELAREFPGRIEFLRESFLQWDRLAAKWQGGQDSIDQLEKGWMNPRGILTLLEGFFGTMKSKDLIHVMESGPEKDFFEVQNTFLGPSLEGCDLPALSEALIQNIGKRGTSRDPAGGDALRTLLIQRFQEYGGKIIPNASVTGIESGAQKNLDLTVSDGSKVQTLFLATAEGISSGVPGLLPGKKSSSCSDPSLRYPLRFYIGMDDRFIPVGMEDNLFMMREDSGGPLGLKKLYLALSPHGSREAPEGKRALTVMALVTEKELTSLTPKLAKEVREDLLHALESVIPFLSEGMDFIQTDVNASRGYRIPRPVGGSLDSRSPGSLGRASVRTTLKGKVLLLLPAPWELGLEGEALTAVSAARILEKKLRGEG